MASSRPLLGSDPFFRDPHQEQDNHCMVSLFLPCILCLSSERWMMHLIYGFICYNENKHCELGVDIYYIITTS